MDEYSKGVCGADILKNGRLMTVDEILDELRRAADLHDRPRWVAVGQVLPKLTMLDDSYVPSPTGGGPFPPVRYSKRVLVLKPNGMIRIDRLVAREDGSKPRFSDSADATHWMPLPEPPEGE